MKNQKTAPEIILNLQTNLLNEIASKPSSSPTDKFVALVAYCADDPIATLQNLAKSEQPGLPENATAWVRSSAQWIADYLTG